MRFARRSCSVAACTGIMWSNLRSLVMVSRRVGCTRLSFARSAKRGVSEGTAIDSGGVATREGAGVDCKEDEAVSLEGGKRG